MFIEVDVVHASTKLDRVAKNRTLINSEHIVAIWEGADAELGNSTIMLQTPHDLDSGTVMVSDSYLDLIAKLMGFKPHKK